MIDNGALCVLPWIHLNLSPDGYATLCCQSGEHLYDDEGRPLNAQTHSLQEIWGSRAMREIRQSMLAGEKLPHCSACYRNEEFGWGSSRLGMNSLWFGSPDDADPMRRLDPDSLTEEAGPPRYFDLRIGNLCNLKCVNCRSLYSSQIERDPVHVRWSNPPYVRLAHRFAGQDEWSESPLLLEEMKAISSDVREIQLAGGEPTLNKLLIEWLAHLCGTGQAKEIDIGLVTNLTNVQPRILDLLSQFRQVDVKISLDGYGDVYEYVRFPGKWRTIERNVERIATLPNKVNITVFPVLNVYNTLDLVPLFEWAEERGFTTVATVVRASDHVDCRLLPQAARTEARRRFDAFFARHAAKAGGVLPERLATLARQIETAFAEIEATSFDEKTLAHKLLRFMQFTNDMDVSRGTSFRDTCPETYAAMTEAYGPWNPAPRYAVPSPGERI